MARGVAWAEASGRAPDGSWMELRLHHRPSDLCMSAVTLAELRYGADRRRSRKLHGLIDVFASTVGVVPFDQDAAAAFGRVGATMAQRGSPIGQIDTSIAGHALSLGLILVTNNTKHLARVRGLRIENWV